MAKSTTKPTGSKKPVVSKTKASPSKSFANAKAERTKAAKEKIAATKAAIEVANNPRSVNKTVKTVASKPRSGSGLKRRTNQGAIVAKIRKDWNAKGASWCKKFNLPESNQQAAKTILIQRIRYGKVTIEELS